MRTFDIFELLVFIFAYLKNSCRYFSNILYLETYCQMVYENYESKIFLFFIPFSATILKILVVRKN